MAVVSSRVSAESNTSSEYLGCHRRATSGIGLSNRSLILNVRPAVVENACLVEDESRRSLQRHAAAAGHSSALPGLLRRRVVVLAQQSLDLAADERLPILVARPIHG